MSKAIKSKKVTICEGIDFAIDMEKLDVCEKSFLAGMVKAFIAKKKIIPEQ
ncbi:hypothetical protein IZT13_002874 [Clostridium perfringens]|nr:hypothetical protein [Clostridium perfringens]